MGIVIIMAIFNLFLYITLKDKSYLYYFYKGYGIGLGVVKRVIDRHKGEKCAESKKGECAVFYFSI
jgi:light-regulated signal transduction histidine kinase (bacteriophytochrome)